MFGVHIVGASTTGLQALSANNFKLFPQHANLFVLFVLFLEPSGLRLGFEKGIGLHIHLFELILESVVFQFESFDFRAGPPEFFEQQSFPVVIQGDPIGQRLIILDLSIDLLLEVTHEALQPIHLHYAVLVCQRVGLSEPLREGVRGRPVGVVLPAHLKYSKIHIEIT